MNPVLVDVLKIVNEVREKALDVYPLKELPKGNPNRSKLCPIAKALNCYVYEEFLLFDNEDVALVATRILNAEMEKWGEDEYFVNHIPQILTDFVSAFDKEQYPELIEKEEK